MDYGLANASGKIPKIPDKNKSDFVPDQNLKSIRIKKVNPVL